MHQKSRGGCVSFCFSTRGERKGEARRRKCLLLENYGQRRPVPLNPQTPTAARRSSFGVVTVAASLLTPRRSLRWPPPQRQDRHRTRAVTCPRAPICPNTTPRTGACGARPAFHITTATGTTAGHCLGDFAGPAHPFQLDQGGVDSRSRKTSATSNLADGRTPFGHALHDFAQRSHCSPTSRSSED